MTFRCPSLHPAEAVPDDCMPPFAGFGGMWLAPALVVLLFSALTVHIHGGISSSGAIIDTMDKIREIASVSDG